MKQIFISYARADDEAFVRELYGDLEHAGLSTWFDREAMESRGRTFLQELRDAIADDRLDRLVLVVGPKAAASEVVKAEWGFALEACRIVIPILRIGESTLVPTAVASQDFKLVPGELSKLHSIDFRPARNYTAALRELIRVLKAPVEPLAPLHAVEALPAHYLGRPLELSRLNDAVLADLLRPEVVTLGKQVVGLSGMGGIGKTVLASAFARSCQVRRSFDAVVWLRIGQKPSVLECLRRAGTALGDTDTGAYADPGAAVGRLAGILAQRKTLLVLDDVWEVAHVAPFRDAVAGTRCRLLLTTRIAGIPPRLGAILHDVGLLDNEDALCLLAEWAGAPAKALPDIASRVAGECGGLPLALSMVGAMIRLRGGGWDNALHKLKSAELSKLRQEFPNYPYPDLLRAFQVSVDALREREVQARYPRIEKRYFELAVFPPGVAVPEDALGVLWGASGLDTFSVQDYVDALAERSLLRRGEGGRIILHDLQADYVRGKATNTAALHRRLIDAYRKECPRGWSSGPDDGYFFQNLPFHVNEGKGGVELAGLLFDYEWLRAKLKATDSWQLSADFELLKEDCGAKALRQALEMSASRIARNPTQLAPHLCGRLSDSTDTSIRKLLESVARKTEGIWLRPLTPCLSTPGGLLLRILDAGLTWITALARLPSGELACASHDGTIYLWDLDSGRRREFYGHEHWVEALILTPDGRLISSGADSTVREWDTESGTSRVLLERRATALALLPGGVVVGAGYKDGLWALKLGSKKPQLLKGHADKANNVIALPGGRLVSAGEDILRIWDPDLRSSRAWKAKKDGLKAFAATSGGKILLGGNDGAILELDPDSLAQRPIVQYGKYLEQLAVSPKGRVASADSDGIHIWRYGAAALTALAATGVKSLEWLSEDRLAAGCYDGKVRLFDVSRDQTHVREPTEPVRALGITDAGWVVFRREEGPVLGWHYQRKTERKILDKGDFFGSIAIASNGLVLRDAAAGDHVIAVMPGVATPRRYHIPDSEFYVELADANGTRVVAAQHEPGRIWVWDTPDDNPKVLKLGESVSDVRTNLAGQVIACSYDGTVRIWAPGLRTSRLLEKRRNEDEEEGASSVAISDDGRWAAVGMISGVIHLWDLRSGRRTDLYGHEKDFVTALAFLPGGHLLSGGHDSTLRLWDMKRAEELARLELEANPDHVVLHRSGVVVVGDYAGRVYSLEVRLYPRNAGMKPNPLTQPTGHKRAGG